MGISRWADVGPQGEGVPYVEACRFRAGNEAAEVNVDLLENVRTQCRRVAETAESVSIERAALDAYAASLPLEGLILPKMDPGIHYLGHDRDTVAYFLVLDAVNFGSGYFPRILKDARRSGYRHIAAALADCFARKGSLRPQELRTLDEEACAGIFRLDLSDSDASELASLFRRALNDLGTFICDRFGGEFPSLLEEAGCSAARLVEVLAAMPMFCDAAPYKGYLVPFYKRAQLLAVDLFIAFGGSGFGRFYDIDRLTICADNLVPHVLRLDGVLRYDNALSAAIEEGVALGASSPEEVEIRGCAVHAAELIVAELRKRDGGINAMMLDNYLWHRGQEPEFRARPRHLTKTFFY